jgi:hypothetical protein
MTAHVATGILALLLVLVHSAFAPGTTIGGHALWALAALVLTGAVGRYFYSFLPRATNGNELELHEINAIIAADLSHWDSVEGDYQRRVHDEIQQLIADCRWNHGFLDRLRGLARIRAAAKTTIQRLRKEGLARGLTESQADRIAALADRAFKTALGGAHLEDLRALLNSWRYLHRWLALLMVLLTIAHVVLAMRYTRWGP